MFKHFRCGVCRIDRRMVGFFMSFIWRRCVWDFVVYLVWLRFIQGRSDWTQQLAVLTAGEADAANQVPATGMCVGFGESIGGRCFCQLSSLVGRLYLGLIAEESN